MNRPIVEGYKIQDLEEKHIEEVIKIAEEELGAHYFEYDELIKVIKKPNEYICKVAVASTSKVCGFSFCKITSLEELKSYLKLSDTDLPIYLLHSKKIGIIKTVAINKTNKKQGIGSAVVQACYKRLIAMNTDTLACVAWKKGDVINIGRILDKMAFENYKEIKEYWAEESKENGFKCPNCGSPCKCSAIMYFRAV